MSMRAHPFHEVFNDKKFKQEATIWMAELGKPTHAVTLTFKRFDPRTGQGWSREDVSKSCKVFLDILNKKTYKRAGMKHRKRLMSVVVLGLGVYGDHPHAHLAVGSPEEISFAEFSELIRQAALSTFWIDRIVDIQPCRDTGWLVYMLDHGWNNVLLELTEPAKP